MKRAAIFLAAALVLLLMLAGCSQKTEENTGNGQVETPPAQTENTQPGLAATAYYGKWYDEKLPYNELELKSDGTYSSALFDDGTYSLEGDFVILDGRDAEYAISISSDGQKLSYNNICYVKTPYQVPEVFVDGYSEGIFITISHKECSGTDIVTVNPEGDEIPVQRDDERALVFSASVQDLNTYPWYDGEDILIFGGFYADNGFVSGITKTYTPFKIISIKNYPWQEDNGAWVHNSELAIKTEDGAIHDISMAYRENNAENSYSVALTSDLFEGHVFTMNNMVVHKEPIIAD